jgi:hypothetical protein
LIADAPAQGYRLHTIGDSQVKYPTPGEGPVRLLSLEGQWVEARVSRSKILSITPERLVVSGMSGSPILSMLDEAIGLVSVTQLSPVLVEALPAGLLRAIVGWQSGGKVDEIRTFS